MSQDEKIDTFEVTVLGWEKHNGRKKKGHTHIMISTRFFDDYKVAALSSQDRCAYLWMLLRCGDEARATIVANAKQMRSEIGANTLRVRSVLTKLESLQLIRIEKITPLIQIKLKDNTLREDKLISAGSKGPAAERQPVLLLDEKKPEKQKPTTETNRKVWESYCAAYLALWKVPPTRNAVVNSAIANFVRRVGETDAPSIIEFFVGHKDTLYLKTQHDIKLALRDAESLRTQWLRGRAITMKDVKEFERKDHYKEQSEKIMRSEI